MAVTLILAIAVGLVQVGSVLQENIALQAHKDHYHVQVECSVTALSWKCHRVCVKWDIFVNQEPLFPIQLMVLLVIFVLRDITVKWEQQILQLAQGELILMLQVEEHLMIVLSALQGASVRKMVCHCLVVCVQRDITALGECQYPVMHHSFVLLVINALRAVPIR